MLAIPQFDLNNDDHIKLATIGKECQETVRNHTFPKKGFKSMRNEALRLLKARIAEIDKIVKHLVK